MKTFGQVIHQAHKSVGLTQKTVAEQLQREERPPNLDAPAAQHQGTRYVPGPHRLPRFPVRIPRSAQRRALGFQLLLPQLGGYPTFDWR
jgi:hypothetical protein